MEKIPYEEILKIQRKVNIVDIIAEYLPLEKKGKNYFAVCPFHDDHNPSMSISPEKQIYTCFVCGASGNVFNFVMNYEHITFSEAIAKVAAKIGIDFATNSSFKTIKKDDRYDKYYNMFSVTNKYYQNNIKTIYGKKATDYLSKRNITEEEINEFGIGLSLNDNNVSKLLLSKGYDKNDIMLLGLCGDSGGFTYDTFKNRIMFPLFDTEGKVVGFSGRIYNNEKESKYVNSKESPVFKKGKLLYNFHRALNYAREKKQIIVVEGFMDVIRLYTIGIKNVVATMGTAVTKEQAALIRRLSKNVVLCFDGDKAGEKATISALEELERIGLEPKVIRLEDNMDPDEYVLKKAKAGFDSHLKNAMTALQFKLEQGRKKTDFNDYNEISKYLNSVAKELEKIDDPIVYELTIKKLSKETGVEFDTINKLISSIPKKEVKQKKEPKVYKKNKYEMAEEYLVHYMLRSKDAILLYKDKVSYLTNKTLALIALKILDFYEQNNYVNATDFSLYLQDDDELIKEVLRIDSINIPSNVSKEVILDYINTIDEGILKREIKNTKDKIRGETNVAKKVVLLEKLATLKKKECKWWKR